MRDDAGMDAVTPACQVGAARFHQDHRFVAEITARAAIFLGHRRAEQAQFTRPARHVSRSICPCLRHVS